MEESEAQIVPAEPPQAIYHARVDEKGRLKLPRDFEGYLRTFPEQQFFITTLDGEIARIYPIATWRDNATFFETCRQHPRIVEAVAFATKVYGATTSLDKDGRILIPPALRRKLGVENQPVWVGYYKGAVELYNEAVYNERMQRIAVDLPEKLDTLRELGLK